VLLDEGGADPHAADGQGRTAMHHAVALREDKLVSKLIALGADVNARDCSGLSPLLAELWCQL
jgi:ankyrin repeat protein